MKELLPYLPNVQEVVLPGIGHTATFFAVQPEASSRLINTFFDSGKVDDSLYHPQTVDFTPACSARDCRLNGGTGWSEIRKESDHG
jgi:hypothetical protein